MLLAIGVALIIWISSFYLKYSQLTFVTYTIDGSQSQSNDDQNILCHVFCFNQDLELETDHKKHSAFNL